MFAITSILRVYDSFVTTGYSSNMDCRFFNAVVFFLLGTYSIVYLNFSLWSISSCSTLALITWGSSASSRISPSSSIKFSITSILFSFSKDFAFSNRSAFSSAKDFLFSFSNFSSSAFLFSCWIAYSSNIIASSSSSISSCSKTLGSLFLDWNLSRSAASWGISRPKKLPTSFFGSKSTHSGSGSSSSSSNAPQKFYFLSWC